MWAQVNELLFKKYFGTRPGTPLHNLYPSKPIFTRPKDGWTGGWLSACLTLVEDDTEPIQQRQQLGTLLGLKVVQLQTSKLVFSKILHRSINTHHSNGQHRRSIPWYKLTHEVSMNSPTRLPAVRGTNDIVNLTQPLLYNVLSAVLRLQEISYKRLK